VQLERSHAEMMAALIRAVLGSTELGLEPRAPAARATARRPAATTARRRRIGETNQVSPRGSHLRAAQTAAASTLEMRWPASFELFTVRSRFSTS
jgi:hypothetical protein